MKIIISFVLLVICLKINSQVTSDFTGVSIGGEYVPFLNNQKTKVKSLKYLTVNWTNGNLISHDSSIFTNIALRYDITNDRMEIKSFINTEIVKKINIGNQFFIYCKFLNEGYVESGYFEVLNEGEISLLIRRKIKYIPGVIGAYGSDDKQIIEKVYYLKIKNKPATEIELKKKSILNQLPKNIKKEVIAFMEKKKVNMRKVKDICYILSNYNNK